jgi:arginyl-tRNA synthetase
LKDAIASLVRQALEALAERGELDAALIPAEIRVERARDRGHADLATNVALVLAKPAGRPPRELAEAILGALPEDERVARAETAGPGFLNFFLHTGARAGVVRRVLEAGEAFGRSEAAGGTPVHIEFVSANPTGPLHVGHGRGAAFGASVANLLEAVGHRVHREYYVNDGGRQMDILAVSVWLRYLEELGVRVAFPANGYRGDYVRRIARSLCDLHGDALVRDPDEVSTDLPPDEPDGGDKEAHADALVRRARTLLGEQWAIVFEHGLAELVADIRDDLAAFGVDYAEWFSERSLFDSGAVDRALEHLRAGGWLYERDGATWFRSAELGDEKDRVVVRENGDKTYFGADIAYHWSKVERGHAHVIDVLGADHHGYIARMSAAMQALDVPREHYEVLLVQFAVLYRGGEKIPMSTRAGQFVTLRELREEVGTDAARFFYVLRRNDQHLDFDLDLAKAQTQDNPVYYVQYAHARIASVLRQLASRGLCWDRERGLANLQRLDSAHETALVEALERYPETVAQAAANREPHRICYYLLEDVANAFHTWYNAEQFLVEDDALRDARLSLVQATGQVIRNGLALVGVSAPESM